MDEATRSGEGEFDLREYSPNYLQLNQEQIQERMMNSFSEQTSELFNEIISGKNLKSDGTLSDIEVAISQPSRDPKSMMRSLIFLHRLLKVSGPRKVW